jgi:hypothetical protein
VTLGVSDRKRAVMGAVLAVGFAFVWQLLLVRCNYEGNWTSLFCTGANLTQPPALAKENIYLFPHSNGYDGQFYHYVAHDPLFRRGFARYIDGPALRYRRILVPGLVYLMAGGQDRAIDPAFFALNLFMLFVGVYWSCRYVTHFAHHPMWGLLFLLVPAVLISVDRITVDIALTALCVGFALYLKEERPGHLYVLLLLAPLVRETGWLLTAAYCISLLLERRIFRAVVFASCTAPAAAWYAFVHSHTSRSGVEGWFAPVPLAGLLDRVIHPVTYPFLPAVRWTAVVLDECALAAVMLAFVVSFWPPKAKFPVAIRVATILMSVMGIYLGSAAVWSDAFAFGRIFSPLIALIALEGCWTGRWWGLVPAALLDPRIGLQLVYQLLKVAQALFG